MGGTDSFALLHDGVAESAAFNPRSNALVLGDRRVSYAELTDTALAWAGLIRSLNGGRTGQRICVVSRRSMLSYAGMLAVLYSGNIYVPLSPDSAPERTRHMVRTADPAVVLYDDRAAKNVVDVIGSAVSTGCRIIYVRDLEWSLAAGDSFLSLPTPGQGATEPQRACPDDLAYIMFTSGSTGIPKGVAITHRAINLFLLACQSSYDFGPEDRFSQAYEQTFDPSLFDIFLAWRCGAAVYPLEHYDLADAPQFIRDADLTVWASVPLIAARQAHFSRLDANSLPSLRYTFFCGEQLRSSVAQAWSRAAQNARIYNLYGPTETTVTCAAYEWHPDALPSGRDDVVPIGRPNPGVRFEIRNAERGPILPGTVGELYIGGETVFSGYLAVSGSDTSSLVPLAPGDDDLYYRTGDLVRQEATGNLVFVGRMDRQVKLRGHRVELGEIEYAVAKVLGNVVVLSWPLDADEFDGYAVVHRDPTVNTRNLRQKLRVYLPDYAMPVQEFYVDEFPVNENHKVDRRALRELIKLRL
jgi:amino acid adenylation domain-containing protein